MGPVLMLRVRRAAEWRSHSPGRSPRSRAPVARTREAWGRTPVVVCPPLPFQKCGISLPLGDQVQGGTACDAAKAGEEAAVTVETHSALEERM